MTTLQIIYEDAILLVCNKPAGLMVEPDRNNHPNLLQQVGWEQLMFERLAGFAESLIEAEIQRRK